MERADQCPVPALSTYESETKESLTHFKRASQKMLKGTLKVLTHFETYSMVIGFLLGRAIILSQLSPFCLPFFASLYFLKTPSRLVVFCCLLLGAATISLKQDIFVLFSVISFITIRASAVKMTRGQPTKRVMPILVFISAFLGRALTDYLSARNILITDMLLAFVEASLSAVLVMIFMQSLPLFSNKIRRRTLKHEEMICFTILIASVLTGMIGFHIQGIALEHVFSRYIILIFAYIGGAAVGATVGVVVGLILGLSHITYLYQMSLLAFSGLLGGLLREGKKPGTALGLLLGSLLIGLYSSGYQQVPMILVTSLCSIGCFFLTPSFMLAKLAAYIPGTASHSQQQQQYLKKLRNVTADRVQQFSSLFQVLSNSFSRPIEENPDYEQDVFLSKVTEQSCQTCFRKEQCWIKNFHQTYDYMNQIRDQTLFEQKLTDPALKKNWKVHCIKSDKVIQLIYDLQRQYQEEAKLKRRVRESRQLVADQLLGVSQVMENFANEITREKDTHLQQEDLILKKLQSAGLDIESVEIYNLEKGKVDIEMIIANDQYGECEKIIAPILSDVLGEAILVDKKEIEDERSGLCHVTFGSSKAFDITVGVSHVAKGGGLVSGDHYTDFELSAGTYVLAISDGMGSGERAHLESEDTLKLLSTVLQSGIDEKIAIKSINSILSLRTTEEIFSTLDLTMIDMQEASAKFLKVGTNPSFIKRGNTVQTIETGNLPIGLVNDFDIDVTKFQLKAGDILIMMSDGVFEGPRHVQNKDIWMRRKIKELETEHPQDIADLLLEEVIRSRGGAIDDDMTVLVSKIEHHIPKWSVISTYTKGEYIQKRA